jgi:hypothetical protein
LPATINAAEAAMHVLPREDDSFGEARRYTAAPSRFSTTS